MATFEEWWEDYTKDNWYVMESRREAAEAAWNAALENQWMPIHKPPKE